MKEVWVLEHDLLNYCMCNQSQYLVSLQ